MSHRDAKRSHIDAKRTVLSVGVETIGVDVNYLMGSEYRKVTWQSSRDFDPEVAFWVAKTEKDPKKRFLSLIIYDLRQIDSPATTAICNSRLAAIKPTRCE